MRISELIPLVVIQILVVISTASALQQHPLLDQTKGQNISSATSSQSTSKWNLNFTSEAPHYFASVYGLLHQWSNTFFPNGHSIVPCVIPPLTKLYHGRTDGDVPPSPEWVAFDMHVSYPALFDPANCEQRDGIRNYGRHEKFPYAYVSDDKERQMHLL